jgi:hypothetical protein
MTATHLIFLYFFDGLVHAASCANMLEAGLTQQETGFMEDLWL